MLLDALNKLNDAVVHGGSPSTEPLVAARDRTSTFCVNCFLDGGSFADRATEIFSTTAVFFQFPFSATWPLPRVVSRFRKCVGHQQLSSIAHIAHRGRLSRGVQSHVNLVTSVLHVV